MNEIEKIVEEKAFCESGLEIMDALRRGKSSTNPKTGRWPLLDKNGRALIKNETYRPLTLLEKRWLKSLLSDPRIALFHPDESGLEDVEPLFLPEDIVLFDQFSDGDPYQEERYIEIFQELLKAIKDKKSVKILYLLKNGTEKWIKCHPVRLEYSQRDDKFRLIAASKAGKRIVNLAKIKKCESMDVTEPLQTKNLDCVMHDKRTVELLLKDERQALERVMMQLSIYEKITEKLDDTTYKIAVTYEVEDEIEIMIQILSFGPNLKVTGPERFVEQIRNRLRMQKSCGR